MRSGTRSKLTPEGQLKFQIYEWLDLHPRDCMFWPHNNGAQYDPKIGKFRKPNSRWYMPGVADIEGIWRGAPLYIEAKGPDARVTDEQRLFLQRVAHRGGIAILAYTVEDVAGTLERIGSARGIFYEGERCKLKQTSLKL